MKNIVICGGHLTPALALIEQLKKNQNIEIFFFGRKFSTEGSNNFSAEYVEVKKEKRVLFYSIIAGRLQRKFTRYTIFSILKTPIGFAQSFIYLLKTRPKIIVSFGGYLSFPIVFSGWLLGIKSITHEQSAVAGLASKVNSLFAEKVFLTWSQTIGFFPKEKSQIIGNLTRKVIFNKKAEDLQLKKFIKNPNKLILVMGGNQGSHFLNTSIYKILPKLSKFQILHQIGTANFGGDFDKAKKIKQKNYLPTTYIDSQNIGAVLNRADLIISRSGANTVWDIAVLGKNAIFVPLPISAGSEQLINAHLLRDAGSCQILEQDKFNEEMLLAKINQFFTNSKIYQKKAAIFQKKLNLEAASTISDYILNNF